MVSKTSIVFPTDFSETSVSALHWARRMAEQMDAELHCISVVEPPIVYTSMEVPTAVPTIEETVQQAEAQMDEFAKAHLTGFGHAPITRVLAGRPVDEITGYARENGAAMIVMSTHGRSGLRHLLIGSTAEGVVRHASCPVLTVRGPEAD
ncbi:MAG: universal stress protein [Gammaproteobacteria bacterium]|jgi:universal stress protein A